MSVAVYSSTFLILTIEILEVRQLYSLSHAQHICRTAKGIEQHPHVASIERRDRLRRFFGRMPMML